MTNLILTRRFVELTIAQLQQDWLIKTPIVINDRELEDWQTKTIGEVRRLLSERLLAQCGDSL